jgi:hypothetical protein
LPARRHASLMRVARALLAAAAAAAAALPPAAGFPGEAALAATFDRCNVPRLPSLSLEHFLAVYKGRRPVVFRRPANETAGLAAATTRAALLGAYAARPVVLASSNSFSYTKRRSTFGAYVAAEVDAAAPAPGARSNESWYLFGDTPTGDGWAALVGAYRPPLDAAADSGLVAWGVGGRYSGVSFHTHGAAFAETAHGRKRWFLTAPSVTPPSFDPDEGQLTWALRREGLWPPQGGAGNGSAPGGSVEAAAAADVSAAGAVDATTVQSSSQQRPRPPQRQRELLECTAAPGEVIYIPPQWWHATLNLDDWNVFFSVFTQEPFELASSSAGGGSGGDGDGGDAPPWAEASAAGPGTGDG